MMGIIEASKMKRSSIMLRFQILLIVLMLQAAFHSNYALAQTTPPSVSITSPTKNAILKGTVTVTVQASSPDGIIAYVEVFYIQGTFPQDIPPGPKAQGPYTWTWDTSTVENGTYTLQAQAVDDYGNSATSEFNVTVANGPPSAPALTPGSLGVLVVIVALAAIGVMILYRRRSKSNLNLPRTSATQYLYP